MPPPCVSFRTLPSIRNLGRLRGPLTGNRWGATCGVTIRDPIVAESPRSAPAWAARRTKMLGSADEDSDLQHQRREQAAR